jgi:Zn-dependent peptidase ImmA (M78 family)
MIWIRKRKEKEIEDYVLSLCIHHQFSYPEDSLLELAKRMGIEVRKTHFDDFNICGMLFLPEFSDDEEEKMESVKIFLRSDDCPERRTFFLAHELGHFCLHKNQKTAYRLDRNECKAEESEANCFAYNLLMPRKKFQEARRFLRDDIGSLASYFSVSRSAIWHRVNGFSSGIPGGECPRCMPSKA